MICLFWFQSVSGGFEEGVGVMSDSVAWVFQFASEAVERCLQLTGGWGLNGLLKALQVRKLEGSPTFKLYMHNNVQTLFSQYVSKISSGIHQLRRECGFKAGEEWIDLQHAFTLIQICGDILLRTQNLAEQLSHSILNAAPNLLHPASSAIPFSYYDYLAVYHPEERTAAIELLTSLQNG